MSCGVLPGLDVAKMTGHCQQQVAMMRTFSKTRSSVMKKIIFLWKMRRGARLKADCSRRPGPRECGGEVQVAKARRRSRHPPPGLCITPAAGGAPLGRWAQLFFLFVHDDESPHFSPPNETFFKDRLTVLNDGPRDFLNKQHCEMLPDNTSLLEVRLLLVLILRLANERAYERIEMVFTYNTQKYATGISSHDFGTNPQCTTVRHANTRSYYGMPRNSARC